MGFKISWIGFDGPSKAEVLVIAGLRDTGQPDEFNETPLSGAEFPGGWFILFANNFDFVTPRRLSQLSANCRIVACQLHEGVMVSAAHGYERGNRLWELTHNGQEGVDDLSISGSPPPSFDAIRRRLAQEQESTTGDVDYIFDIPVEVAGSICNYRHDRVMYDWGQPQFIRLDPR
jgi:hypothetical protein